MLPNESKTVIVWYQSSLISKIHSGKSKGAFALSAIMGGKKSGKVFLGAGCMLEPLRLASKSFPPERVHFIDNFLGRRGPQREDDRLAEEQLVGIEHKDWMPGPPD